ncbi:unnamed protein product [Lactuca virosa]|uniref:Uncharacterized protein n=1 Tax=Lactuca virosa TaxID=75947 RepID=A0AAU9LVT2_9ASTR|nr:unnamed protein product [Lactuca virosa]
MANRRVVRKPSSQGSKGNHASSAGGSKQRSGGKQTSHDYTSHHAYRIHAPYESAPSRGDAGAPSHDSTPTSRGGSRSTLHESPPTSRGGTRLALHDSPATCHGGGRVPILNGVGISISHDFIPTILGHSIVTPSTDVDIRMLAIGDHVDPVHVDPVGGYLRLLQ